MKFGVLFFPTVGPQEKSAADYYDEALRLAVLADELGFHHLKIVEHYFFDFGGYSPDPVTFLAAAAARTSRIRLCTGAVIPAFTHPVKLAGKLAMLDGISGGRLDVGFGRAFLPDEFAAFEIPIDESRARYEEGVEACRRLWAEEDVVWEGDFYRFGPVTLLPRPVQQPHPPVFSAVTASPESVEAAARAGRNLQIIAAVSPKEKVQEMLDLYRKTRASAGHDPDTARVELSYSLFLDEDGDEARRGGRHAEQKYGEKIAEAVKSWKTTTSTAYPGYEKLAEAALRQGATFDERVAANRLLAGTPEEVRAQIDTLASWYGDDVDISLTVHSGHLPYETSARALRLFAERVTPGPAPLSR
ncbi:alkanesulfonate monooxygenase SsuD/methylene tetrahydromethanopterin reductase-like flavin-dependent oxidoreductase (luciferase family) [Streptosporangium becharense]|uniref:Alkanesulfonate monooxygenase SsuD/methylene tetrahydromethanopterin reductase-like flavin-dependent oxidoreductase (Luciferase family) n=1 Tax=Streptosporangium becharense TaxID=1816182 RepID=A0A7W9MK68_9ACTN|nr:LLM class flavin-dependent oxidoreductase [Streptosporangium becharense]MBB2910441.1 alkanesulfonate monooxygenase SsuD/methylene tetrahydromethanopterin reductase-like flavin-dependent oxidoreductase (luciferase family) [Streptosporangium becharense]MBB5823184.1 alkanesulfonate monooxygenase SsuD/methylene tetrahydromethanopterin reductase-like flavin-dependent oxidoreductase (luciferase family) [Streptosporangium becharense]